VASEGQVIIKNMCATWGTDLLLLSSSISQRLVNVVTECGAGIFGNRTSASHGRRHTLNSALLPVSEPPVVGGTTLLLRYYMEFFYSNVFNLFCIRYAVSVRMCEWLNGHIFDFSSRIRFF
jgi:hypothetical protein